jgi:hypothetical protein
LPSTSGDRVIWYKSQATAMDSICWAKTEITLPAISRRKLGDLNAAWAAGVSLKGGPVPGQEDMTDS